MSKYQRIQTYKMVKVSDDLHITPVLYNYLVTLYEALEDGAVWVPAPRKMHSETIRRAVSEGWIFPSRHIDTGAIEYKILHNGIELLEQVRRRRTRPAGCKVCGCETLYQGYLCKPCYLRIDAANRRARRKQNADKPCHVCKSAPRHVTASGVTMERCTDCMRTQRAEWQTRRVSKMCPVCGAPVYRTASAVYSYCQQHRREYMARYWQRRKFRKFTGVRRIK